MTARSRSALALIIDHDVGFLMWLGEMFTELGWQTVPALHCRQALALAKRLNTPISTLLVDPELSGAARMIKTLAAANPGMRVVLIRDTLAGPSPGSVAGPVRADASGIQARSTLERPSPWEPISRADWVAKLQQALARASGN